MESLLLSTAGSDRQVFLYAVSDGVPLYFKHNELLQKDGYQLLWWGTPDSVTEQEAAQWVARCAPERELYINYQQAHATPCLTSALASFRSAVLHIGCTLEYAPGTTPREVLIGEIPA